MTNRKATHNGTCQACGAVHAVNAKTGRLAKHGYTVKWGYFDGVCMGADELPMEHDTEVAERVIESLNQQAHALETKTIDDVVAVEVRTGHRERTVFTKEEFLLREMERLAHVEDAEYRASLAYMGWEREAETVVRNGKWRAKGMRQHVSHIAGLMDTRHGQELFPREKPEDTQRIKESFQSLGEAYDRADELKAEGWKTRVTRCKYSNKADLSATRKAA